MPDIIEDDLGHSIPYDDVRKKMKEPYVMQLVGEDAELVKKAVNIGIDAHLEACFIPDLGDRYEVRSVKVKGMEISRKLDCHVSFSSLPVLIRRLFEMDEDRAHQLAHDILDTLGLEEP